MTFAPISIGAKGSWRTWPSRLRGHRPCLSRDRHA